MKLTLILVIRILGLVLRLGLVLGLGLGLWSSPTPTLMIRILVAGGYGDSQAIPMTALPHPHLSTLDPPPVRRRRQEGLAKIPESEKLNLYLFWMLYKLFPMFRGRLQGRL